MKLSDLPASVQATLRAEGKVPKRARGMNRLECAFLDDWCRRNARDRTIAYESITLKLGHDCRYTPDFVSTRKCGLGRIIEAYEVKGFRRDDAMIKLRVAARTFPWIVFFLVERRKAGGWKIAEVPSS